MPRRFLNRLEAMCPAAHVALLGTLRLCCTMAFCSFILLIHIGELRMSSYGLYRTAMELATSPAGLLLLAVIASVLQEEKSQR